MARNSGITRTAKRQTQNCTQCNYRFDTDKTQCPSCRHFNIEKTYSEATDGTILLSDAAVLPVRRIPTGPWDPCFGIEIDEDGKEHIGIVSNSSTLIGGAPGAGKSTLALQLCGAIVDSTGREVLYIATEEATSPIRARALRLGIRHVDRIRMIPIGVDADLGAIMRNRKPAAFVIDSLSNAFPDTRDQVEFCKAIKKYCVELDSPALIIDHVNKDVDFAGLMDLQHEVDTTLLFTVYEDEDELRELKTVKTRNGPCAKRFFNMTAKGLVYTDPDEEVEDEDL